MPFGNKKPTTSTKSTTRKKSSGGSKLALPTRVHEPSQNLLDYWWCIYGEKGIGKSSLALAFPDVDYHFMFEPRSGLRGKIIPQTGEEPLTWSRFVDYLGLVVESGKPGRINIDTVDLCAKALEDHIAQKLNIPTVMGVNDFGKTTSLMQQEWWEAFTALKQCGWQVTFISHARKRPKTVRGFTREEVQEMAKNETIPTETQPTARPWAVEYIKQSTEFVGYFGWYQTERVLTIRGSGDIYASQGSHDETHFLQKKGAEFAGSRLEAIPMGNNPKEAFANLKAAWDNKLEGYVRDTQYDNM